MAPTQPLHCPTEFPLLSYVSLLPRAQTLEALSQRYGQRYKWLVLLVIGLGTVAGVLCTSSFNVAVPAMTRHFGLGQAQVQWAMTGFMAAMTVAMLPTSWLLDRFGFRRVFLLSLATLAVASVAGFFAPTFPLVVCARVVQGAAAGVLQPMGILALMRLFSPETQGRASGILTLSIASTPAIAPALGGVLLDAFGWETIFLLGLPFCLVAAVAALYLLPLPRPAVAKRFDWFGVSWLTLATILLIEGVSSLQHSGLASAWTWGQFGFATLALLLFVRHARRHAAPIINLQLFGRRTFTMGTIVSFAYGFGLYASTYLIPVFLQNALAYSASAAGMALVPSGIALVLTLPVAGRMADRYSPKWITLAGLLLFGASFLIFAVLGGGIEHKEMIASTVIGRIGLGLILPALGIATMRNLAAHQLGQSSVVISYARQIGGVMGIAIIAVFIQWRELVYGQEAPGLYTAYAQGFLLLTGILLLASVAAALMKNEPAKAMSER
ncbi:DHA2 family efflux MFS transporter permease subunit [Rhodocyclus tenuis]|uniref:DHA2 family efflux MFS transporter permease subunit n=1 Tax=Rhodocyclus tenuis TaxID=1066 RepID=A0A6L5JVD6_RHOTE|nr:DHA2 family efflux MFS transporter permease subunit [Rhodocyclus gracilis]